MTPDISWQFVYTKNVPFGLGLKARVSRAHIHLPSNSIIDHSKAVLRINRKSIKSVEWQKVISETKVKSSVLLERWLIVHGSKNRFVNNT